jgi:hypothetical protein
LLRFIRLNIPPLQPLLLWQELEQEQEQPELQPPHEQEDEQLQPPQLLQLLQLLQPNPKAGVSAPPLRAIRRTTLYIALTSKNNREPSHTRQRRSDRNHWRRQQETETIGMGTRPQALTGWLLAAHRERDRRAEDVHALMFVR